MFWHNCQRYRNDELLKWLYSFSLILLGGLRGIYSVDTHSPLLLKTQDGFIIDNSLQASENDVRLEDFFWTGSGDGAPPFNRRPNKVFGTDNDIFVKTSTVLATVYVDGSMHDDSDDLCLSDCEDSNIPRDIFPSDRRYWLLTVVSGFLKKDDFPIVERKLAKLYRIAFSRQQSHHLGITNNAIAQNDSSISNRKRSAVVPIDDEFSIGNKVSKSQTDINGFERITTTSFVSADREIERDALQQEDFLPYSIVFNHFDFMKNQHKIEKRNSAAQLNNVVHRVSVLIHNITLASIDEDSHPDNQVESLIQRNGNNFPRNQTEIIYSVFVDDKPVLAATAAGDMKLLSEEEVADGLEKVIYTKAEPYWKEPQATPLIPSTTTVDINGNKAASNQLAIIVQNPWMVFILVSAMIVLVFLLVGLLFMTRAKRIRSAEIKRLTSSKALIGEENGGIDNVAYEKDAANKMKSTKHNKKVGTPTLYFPRPPSASPSTSNSDSVSSYYKPRSNSANNQIYFLNKHTKHHNHNMEEYATITKPRDYRHKRSKHKRKLQNRVASIEERVQVHSPQSSFVGKSDDAFETSAEHGSHYYEHIEAFNPNVINSNYHKNKLFTDQTFSERNGIGLDSDIDLPTEAYNRDVFRAYQRDGRLNDNISIGSFLSMASIRSFPKCNMPVPLSRVLEPLSVTHLDQSDDMDMVKLPRVINSKRKQIDKVSQTAIEDGGCLQRSQSDGADPGVIGPVVWEIHKKQAQDSLSPLRDPVYTRNRFEGLLEGAIKMYSVDAKDTNYNRAVFNDVPGAIRARDSRGRSAIVSMQKSLITPRTTTHILNRPLTAEPFTTNNDNSPKEPPSPYKKAWASGTPSPMVRPLSAGPFHRPNLNTNNPSTSAIQTMQTTNMLSTAPLIEAIQKELKKFNRYDSQ